MNPSSPEGAGSGKGLWGGRFEEGLAPEMVPLNLSLGVDRRMWRQDVLASRAWVSALQAAGVLTEPEAIRIDTGLEAVAGRLVDGGIDAGGFRDVEDEDIHTLVERLLHEEIGELAGKLHTGRSRNDQAATDHRLWALDHLPRVDQVLSRLARALRDAATGSVDLIMPGYTHLQPGQPVRVAHWALSHVWPLVRDRGRLERARRATSVLPLGSGAIAGCPFPVDRHALAEILGFERISPNSMDAVSDRDWIADVLYAGATIGVHLSRLAEDLILFSSSEFGFVRLADGFSTGSSLMPQKRNPDVAELVRGKSGRLIGELAGFLAVLKSLPTGYNRDLQEDKATLFQTVDTLLLVLPALAGAIETMEFRPDRIRAALNTQLLATDLADHLVRRGVPFRVTHEVVGRLVRLAEERGCGVPDLPDELLQEAHPELDAESRRVFDWERSVESRDTPGGTSRRAVLEQLEEATRAIEADPLEADRAG